ncbi:MAG: hypothetical protein ABIK82_23830 [Pseudomonadota bacterium]
MAAPETTGKILRRRNGGYVQAFALSLFGVLCSQACAAAGEPFIMGTDAEEASLVWRWYGRIYGEAFRRMDVPLSMESSPAARLTVIADQGEVHGQTARLFAYADAHPGQVRVDEPIYEARIALHAYGPALQSGGPRRLADLQTGQWRVEYRRGVAICEQTLKPLVAAARLSDVTSAAQGLKKLKAGRSELFCDVDISVRNALASAEFKGVTGYRQALDLGVGMPLYPYLHRSRADLAPGLADALKAMKAEGLIERYFADAQRELEAPR